MTCNRAAHLATQRRKAVHAPSNPIQRSSRDDRDTTCDRGTSNQIQRGDASPRVRARRRSLQRDHDGRYGSRRCSRCRHRDDLAARKGQRSQQSPIDGNDGADRLKLGDQKLVQRLWERLRSENGEIATTLIIFPLAISTLYLSIHLALLYNARQVVAAAAQDALWEAQLLEGTEESAKNAAYQTLQLSGALSNADVKVEVSDTTVRVVVNARADTLLGFLSAVTSEIEGPKERFYESSERQ